MLLKLFLIFFEIGAVSFGGGYGMVSLIREIVLSNGWMTESEFMSFVAVTESTPGPIAVNMATFVGASQGGVFGALVATLGVVLPSFIIILLIAALILVLAIGLKYGTGTVEGIAFAIGNVHITLSGLAVAALVGIILNAVLPGKDYEFGTDLQGDTSVNFKV